MLQRIHERVSGWFAWAIVILIGITFTLFGASYYVGSQKASNTKATVNGVSISKETLNVNYRRLKNRQEVVTAGDEKKLKAEALQRLILDTVIKQEAYKNGIAITRAQVEAAIFSIPQFFEDGKFSREKFQQILSANYYTNESFFHQLEQGMVGNQQRFIFTGGSFILPSELARYLSLLFQSRDYQYVIIGNDLKTSFTLNDKEIQSYYDSHASEYRTKEKVSLDYVTLSMKAIRESIKLSDKQLLTYYQENQGNYMRPAKFKVAHILLSKDKQDKNNQSLELKAKKIKGLIDSGKPFAEIAKQYSADLLSTNGELPWVNAGSLGTAFDKAALSLKKGEVSEPVETKQGLEIIKLIDKQPAAAIAFSKVKENIKKTLISDKAQQVFLQKNDELTDLSYQNPDSLKSVSDTLSLAIKTTPLFTRAGLSQGIASKQALLKLGFSADVLQGLNSQPVQIDDDRLVVVRLNKHEKAKQLPLASVRPEIEAALKKRKQTELAHKLSEQLLKMLNASKSVDALFSENKLQWQTVHKATRQLKKTPEINQFAFTLASPDKLRKVYASKQLSNGEIVLVNVLKITDGKMSDVPKESQAQISKQLQERIGLREYDIFLQEIMKAAKIEVKKGV